MWNHQDVIVVEVGGGERGNVEPPGCDSGGVGIKENVEPLYEQVDLPRGGTEQGLRVSSSPIGL